MDDVSILLSGEYWNPEFADLISKPTKYSVTLRDLKSVLDDNPADDRFQLVVVAQARRGQFEDQQLEQLAAKYQHVPIVLLCGSWCEGETRSGTPVPGLARVYWHQWEGRFENFKEQLQSQGIASWHLPRIATISDHIQHDVSNCVREKPTPLIGISSLTRQGFEMMADAVGSKNVIWIESLDTKDVQSIELSVICFECNSLTANTQQRIQVLQEKFPGTAFVLTLNFPRRSEFQIAASLGIAELVSKPFQLCDLQFAIRRALAPMAA